NDKFYIQKSGAPMGCNLSPVLAETLVSYIFELSLNNCNFKPSFLKFFVDDSFLIINKRYVEKYLFHINKIGKSIGNIQFTIEYEINNILNFLDVQLIKNNESIDTLVYLYQLDCIDCSFKYIGTTCRKLSDRIIEHKKAINNNYIKKTRDNIAVPNIWNSCLRKIGLNANYWCVLQAY
ncbi:uncharacterized protein LOC128961485, partial [Oppia nitens]|uniref:uncharacterized protein LOC128961485 n=1 Tax=Oppia nitens TaxID=1686743 RepID=UPI0023DAD086